MRNREHDEKKKKKGTQISVCVVGRALSESVHVSKMRMETRLSGIRGRIFSCRLGNWFETEMRRYDGDWASESELRRPPY